MVILVWWWEGDQGGVIWTMISGSKKKAWSTCKATLHLFDLN